MTTVTWQHVRTYLELVKFQHTIFALPFALTTAVVCSHGIPPLGKLSWILIAMVSARTAAMGMNRVADAKLDALNPRTKNREIPTGKITGRQAIILVVASSLIFVLAAGMLNTLCFALSFPTLAWLLVYPYAKRFTSFSHLWLGLALGIAPCAVWIALTGKLEWTPFPLLLAVTFWVTGFDIIYATLDYDFDCKIGLHSLVVQLGVPRALWTARLLHAGFVGGLVGFGMLAELGWLYYVGITMTGLLIAYEHVIVSPRDLSRVNVAFFTINGAISLFLFAIVVLDLIV